MKSTLLIIALVLLISSPVFSAGIDEFIDGGNADRDTTTYIFAGDVAPAFKVTTLDGAEIDIEKLSGKVILINYFATWCPPCMKEMPYLESEIYNKIDDDDFVLVCIGREHTEDELVKFKEEKGFNLPMAPDPGREIYSKYAKMMIPRNFVIGRDGKVIYQHIGFETEEFEKMIDIIKAELNHKL